jgi:internalin A
MSQPAANPPKTRQRYRVTLQLLMVAVLVTAVGLGYVRNRAHNQRRIVEAIEAAGGKVDYDFQVPTTPPPATPSALSRWLSRHLGVDYVHTVVGVYLGYTAADDALAAQLAGLHRLEWLAINTTNVTDAGLAHLASRRNLKSLFLGGPIGDQGLISVGRLKRLEELSLAGMQITDAGLPRIECLTRLHYLLLSRTAVTDRGLKSINRLRGLQRLDLSETNISDEGLASLEEHVQLRELHLRGTRIAGAGLAHLSGLVNLDTLYLSGTSITDAALVHLRPLHDLSTLNLDGTEITDAGWVHLADLQRLKQLGLDRTRVSPEGRAKYGIAVLPPTPPGLDPFGP